MIVGKKNSEQGWVPDFPEGTEWESYFLNPDGETYTVTGVKSINGVPVSITKFQGQEMLARIGKFDMVLGHINAMKASQETEISTQGRMFDYAFNSIPEWQRSSQTIQYMATQLGLTSEELDTFFIEANKIELP